MTMDSAPVDVLVPGLAEGRAPSPKFVTVLAAPSRQRKLHLGHFAFMRAVLQGPDTRVSWERYLCIEGEHDDVRNVRRTIQWIRDEFAAAARRHDRFGTARLVHIDVSRLAQGEPELPTLEDFAADHGLQEFSQAEQLQQYQARYGGRSGRQTRHARLIARQLEALSWLERLVAQPPQSGDAVASWLHPDLVVRLEAAGIFTVRHLVERINGLGMCWWGGIRAIGAVKAERIMDWLRTHESSIGLSISSHVRVKPSRLNPHELARVVPRATAIVPLEKFVVPAELDGADGLYRAPRQ